MNLASRIVSYIYKCRYYRNNALSKIIVIIIIPLTRKVIQPPIIIMPYREMMIYL